MVGMIAVSIESKRLKMLRIGKEFEHIDFDDGTVVGHQLASEVDKDIENTKSMDK